LNNFTQQEEIHHIQRQKNHLQQKQHSEATVASQQQVTVVQNERRVEAITETAVGTTTTTAAAAANEASTTIKSSTATTTPTSTNSWLTNSNANASVSPNSSLVPIAPASLQPKTEKDKVTELTIAAGAAVIKATTKFVVKSQKTTLKASGATNGNAFTTSSASPLYTCSSASSSLIAQPPPTKIFKTDHLCVNPYGLPTVAAAAAVGHPCVYCVIPVPVVSLKKSRS
ncbi:hypothetical protein KR222_002929, partial [Zaprionus bogoriensis]